MLIGGNTVIEVAIWKGFKIRKIMGIVLRVTGVNLRVNLDYHCFQLQSLLKGTVMRIV